MSCFRHLDLCRLVIGSLEARANGYSVDPVLTLICMPEDVQ